MRTVRADIVKSALNGEMDVLVHGCNCFCQMGAGVAKTIKNEFPEAYDVDQKTKKGDKRKLGTITIAKSQDLIIVNAYTQFRYGPAIQMNVDYGAIRDCFLKVKEKFSGKRIGMPKIGCGLAGGKWAVVENIIRKTLVDEDITVYYL